MCDREASRKKKSCMRINVSMTSYSTSLQTVTEMTEFSGDFQFNDFHFSNLFAFAGAAKANSSKKKKLHNAQREQINLFLKILLHQQTHDHLRAIGAYIGRTKRIPRKMQCIFWKLVLCPYKLSKCF